MYVDAPNLNTNFVTQLKNQFQSVGIQLTPTLQQAPVSLRILDLHYFHNNPNIVTNSFAVAYTYTLSITVQLFDAQGRSIAGPKTFSASESITLSTNQVLIPGAYTVTRQQLQREVITLVYYWVIGRG